MTWHASRSGPWIATGGLVVVLWLTIAGAFIASPWALALLVLLVPEAVAVDVLARSGRRSATMLVPAVGVALWYAAIVAGVRWFGW